MFVETGGAGLMGTELAKIMDVMPLTHDDIEIRDEKSCAEVLGEADLVIHLAAFVDVVEAEKERELAYETNVIGSRNVSSCAQALYISTDYVFNGKKGNYGEEDMVDPLNYYGLTKLLGEYEVLRNGGKVLRMSFKPRPYKHPRVPWQMFFSGGYVDDMAKEIKWAAEHFDRLPPISHVGLERISLVDFARQTREVELMSLKDIEVPIPRDTSFNLNLWHKLRG